MKLNKNWKFLGGIIVTIILILLMCFYSFGIEEKAYELGNKHTRDALEKDPEFNYQEEFKDNGILKYDTMVLEKDSTIVQSFFAKQNNLERIKINFDFLKDKTEIKGIIQIVLKNEKEEIITKQEIQKNHIRQDEYVLVFDQQKDSKGKRYQIEIKLKEQSFDTELLLVYFKDRKEKEGAILKIVNQLENETQEEVLEKVLDFQELYKIETRQLFFIGTLVGISILVGILACMIYYHPKMKVEKMFLMIIPIIGILYILTMPTFKNHDELYHWYKSYELSIGKLVTGLENGVQGTKMPKSVGEISYQNWETMTYEELQQKLQISLNKEETAILNSETSAVYSFVQYIPQAVGITLTRLVTDKVMLMAYGGRFVNLIVACTFVYFAIKLIPFGKKIILLLAALPIALEGFSSLSPDALTISLAFFYVAFIFYLSFTKNKLKNKDKVILLICSIVMALCKIVYIPLVGLLMIIPKEHFVKKENESANKRKWITITIIAGIAIIINLIWLAYSGRYLANFREGSASIQIANLFSHPINYIQNVLYTLNLNGSDYITSMFGSELGWGEKVQVYSIVPYTLLILFIFSIFTEKKVKRYRFTTFQKIIMTLVSLAIVGLIFTSLYVQWTTFGSTSILGIQGRYFIPILPLMGILIASVLKIKDSYQEKNLSVMTAIVILLVQIPVIAQIIITHL